MLKSSLATFINAMTYPDKTIYPVASQNPQDLYNLVDVYSGRGLRPAARRRRFNRRWHYELHPSAPLAYRGVVFNEMKGAMARPEAAQAREAERAPFSPTTHGRASGLPERIPDLTYEQFVAFYRTYYHPSNARFFLYGDLPVDDAVPHRCAAGRLRTGRGSRWHRPAGCACERRACHCALRGRRLLPQALPTARAHT